MLAYPLRFAALFIPLCLLIASTGVSQAQPLAISDYSAIVRVENDVLVPDYRTPWNAGRTGSGSGTGFLIGKNQFLTNAHVVSDSRILYIKKVGDPKPHKARIIHVAHDCDLAMLEVEDYAAFEGVQPLQLGGIPQLNTTVIAVGYPVGGQRISVTRGVVSRIDFRPYSHSAVDFHLTIQVDAAINPGNSGGPVLQDEKVVGVAFQGYSGAVAQNVGYMIPVPVIERFLKDVEDNNYDHYVDLAVSEFNILNPAQRRALKLPNNGVGVMVANVNAHGSSSGLLEVGDVLLEIDGRPILSNGFVEINGEEINMNEIVERKFAGDKIHLKIWRDQKEEEVEITLKRFLPYLMQAKQYGKKPRYAIFSGLVFQPLDRNLFAAHGLDDLRVRYLFNYFVTEEHYKDRDEVVVLTSVLPAAINTHLRGYAGSVVEEVNGQPIKKLADLYQALNDGKDRDYHVIKIEGQGRPIVLDAKLVKKAHAEILSEYKVPKDYHDE